jgi:hypothetical protein
MFNYKEKWQKFTDWKGWKWVYWSGIIFGCYIFFCDSYNIAIDLMNFNHELFLRRPFYPFFAIKGLVGTSFNRIIVLFLPCLISVFLRANYFRKILAVFVLILLFGVFASFFHNTFCAHFRIPNPSFNYYELMEDMKRYKIFYSYCES